MKVFADDYTVEISTDEDWGMHKADDGYRIIVTPTHNSIVILSGRYVRDTTTTIAGEELDWNDFVGSLELEEFCEDFNEMAIRVSEYADDVVRNRMFDWYKIELTDEQVSEIEKKYSGRENEDFCKAVEGWVSK